MEDGQIDRSRISVFESCLTEPEAQAPRGPLPRLLRGAISSLFVALFALIACLSFATRRLDGAATALKLSCPLGATAETARYLQSAQCPGRAEISEIAVSG